VKPLERAIVRVREVQYVLRLLQKRVADAWMAIVMHGGPEDEGECLESRGEDGRHGFVPVQQHHRVNDLCRVHRLVVRVQI